MAKRDWEKSPVSMKSRTKAVGLRLNLSGIFRFAVGASVHIVGQTCLDDVAFLTVDGFCAESGNLDVGVSDAKEFKSVVHEHFKAFFRK